ncbi:hypothetical protein M8A51_20465 [Schlegelella sp. S2-27]|uniref:Uncharacterized protein n=1 Tax=Caldimonas mangrovi TaxID=2944811 RepID=A0ABT0YT28_9BURK|nr:hypothetical protein [Caldimonas mangrovi]MCM5681909.1 hypothetical protein [Caldimonas mangrovi]
METAYHAAMQALAASAVRGLLSIERDDPTVGAVMLQANDDGSVDVTLLDHAGNPIGGYSL